MVALVCGALAVLSANVSALVPQKMLAGLHASRLEGASLEQLRAQVAGVETDTARLGRDNTLLLSRFALVEHASGGLTQRVGAIEVSLPNLLEARQAGLDSSDVTASIGNGGPVTYAADGGSVSVVQKPLNPHGAPAAAEAEMPPLAVPLAAPAQSPDAFGIALGRPITESGAADSWTSLNARVGTLLLGLRPLLIDAGGGGKRLVAGPLSDAQAAALCTQMSRVGIACETTKFIGTPLAN